MSVCVCFCVCVRAHACMPACMYVFCVLVRAWECVCCVLACACVHCRIRVLITLLIHYIQPDLDSIRPQDFLSRVEMCKGILVDSL